MMRSPFCTVLMKLKGFSSRSWKALPDFWTLIVNISYVYQCIGVVISAFDTSLPNRMPQHFVDLVLSSADVPGERVQANRDARLVR